LLLTLPLPLPLLGINMSCTSTSFLDLDFTPLPPFAEAGLDAESTGFAALLEGENGASFSCRPGPDLTASLMRLTGDGVFAFVCPAEGTSISCMVNGVRDLARDVGDGCGANIASGTGLSLASPFIALVRCSDDDDGDSTVSLTLVGDASTVSPVDSTLLRPAMETASAAAAAAA